MNFIAIERIDGTNAPMTEMTEDSIAEAVHAYLDTFGDGNLLEPMTFDEPKYVNEKTRKPASEQTSRHEYR